MKKVFLSAVHGHFMLKIGILWFRDIEKRPPSLRVYENVRLGFRYCAILQIFYVHLHSSFYWIYQNHPILTNSNLRSTSPRFCGSPFKIGTVWEGLGCHTYFPIGYVCQLITYTISIKISSIDKGI